MFRLLVLALVLLGPGISPAAPLTLDDAQRAAQARAPSLAAPVAAARAAREQAVAAAQRPDPVLRLSIDNLPIDGPERFSLTRDFMTMRSVGLMQTFTREDKRRTRAARFERLAELSQAEGGLRAAALRREVALAWFERRAQEARIEGLRAQRDETRLLADAAQAALRAGRGSASELPAALDAVAQLDQALLGAQGERDAARLALARWTGLPADVPLADPPALDRNSWAERGAAEREHRHPGLALAAARQTLADAEAQSARSEREPDWSAELMFSQRGSPYSNMVSFALSLPLPWDRPQRQDRELAASLARVDEARAEREELAREQQLETERWIAAWRAGRAQLALIDAQRVPLAQQRIDTALAAYRGGGGSLAAVLEARRAALALQLERIAVELDTARAWAQLDALAGGVTP
jgi:outer membrane protein TolC